MNTRQRRRAFLAISLREGTGRPWVSDSRLSPGRAAPHSVGPSGREGPLSHGAAPQPQSPLAQPHHESGS